MTALRSHRSSSYPQLDVSVVALLGDGFVPDATLDEWERSGVATREGGAVLILKDGRRFALTDGLRILGRRNGDSDPYGFTGRLFALRALVARGALISSDGVRLGAAIYDVQFGALATPIAASPEQDDAAPVTDRMVKRSLPPQP